MRSNLSSAKAWLCAWVCTLTMLVASPAAWADEMTVVLFTPSLDFADGVARNAYISGVAEKLSASTGDTWSGKAFARQSDFESALKKGEVDAAVVDAEYFAAKGKSLVALASLTAGGKTSVKMSVVSKNASTLSGLRGKTLVVPKAGGFAKKFVEGEVLGAEVPVGTFFSKIDESKDVRSALNAVELGKADAALVFDTYASGNVLYTTQSVPLPVIVAVSAAAKGDKLTDIKSAMRGLTVKGAGLITGAQGYDQSAVSSYKSAARAKPLRPKLEIQEPSTSVPAPKASTVSKAQTKPTLPNAAPTLEVISIEELEGAM